MTLQQQLQEFDKLFPENFSDVGVSRKDVKHLFTTAITNALEATRLEEKERNDFTSQMELDAYYEAYDDQDTKINDFLKK